MTPRTSRRLFSAARRRGQTLVMFALTLLLVSLMVMMTLSFSTKAKEKMELQQVADQAAYSNAVVTARGFNSIALMNRVQIAHMVAIAGIQAALSYAGVYRGCLYGAIQAILPHQTNYGSQCGGTLTIHREACNAANKLGEQIQILNEEDKRVKKEWEQLGLIGAYLGSYGPLDAFVGPYALAWQTSAGLIYGFEQDAFRLMAAKLDEQTLSREVMRHAAGARGEWSTPNASSFVSSREVGDPIVGSGALTGATIQANPANKHAVIAAMASRGNWWVTARLWEGGLIQKRLERVFNPGPGPAELYLFPRCILGWCLPGTTLPPLPAYDPTMSVRMTTPGPLFPLPNIPSWVPGPVSSFLTSLIPVNGKGDAYFSTTKHGVSTPISPDDGAVIGDDHAEGFLQFWKAPFRRYPLPPEVYVFSALSTASAGPTPFVTNKHEWTGYPLPLLVAEVLQAGLPIGQGLSDTFPTHYLAPLSGIGVWPLFIDYNFSKVAFAHDAYGQPKNFSVMQRNYADASRSPDPWNLFFRFRLNGAGEQYGQGSASNHNAVILGDGTDISLQTALSSGIAYYHRYGHWKEPPNLFNPFWRAGLSRANIDPVSDGLSREWYEDVAETMNRSNVPWAGDAIRQLKRAGFEGVQ